ncbi:MAG: hypothetical protein OXU45_06850 [Candidatus Melainabacteria bacterium]|nr:hypothetical protein [Candidatus Melainabacteria bacterium]
MAHANIFERITTNDKKESSSMNKKALETIKLLGEQVIEIRKIITQKDEVIAELKADISALQDSQNDASAEVKLLRIDQRDMNKQLRGIKAAVTGQELARSAMPDAEEFSHRVVERYEPQKIEQPMSKPKGPVSQEAMSQANAEMPRVSSEADMNKAYHTISDAINTARTKLGLPPHEDLPGTIQEQNRIYSEVQNQKKQAAKSVEQTAKEFTFGRMPRMLDL